ncbi:MAG: hypothetical protein KDI75_07235 [Xanthomonadales bacterium]|nr:hypothetical protein [Xanthomonadales bacterium]
MALLAALSASALQAKDENAQPAVKKPLDRWHTVYQDDEFSIAFDTRTMVRKGLSVTVWVQTKFNEAQKSDYDEIYVEDTGRYTYYCDSREYSSDQFTWRNSAGDVVYSARRKPFEVERRSVAPDTVAEVIYEEVCHE